MARARPVRMPRKAPERSALVRLRRRLSSAPRRSEPRRVATLFALTAALFLAAPLINAAPGTRPVLGTAPPFSVLTTGGSTYSLAADLGVRPVFVEFMHPDCSHCQAMGASLASAHREFAGRVLFVTVAIRLAGFAEPTVASVSAFAERYGHTWTYGIDRGTTARDAYGVRGTPTFVFIGADGVIVNVRPGEMSLDALGGALAAVAGA